MFDVGHPVADAGDDRSAGPIMELVIDYWPNHYMALYHAGMAEYMLGQRDLLEHNLQEFLKYYHERDGWTQNATDVLKRLDDPQEAPMKSADLSRRDDSVATRAHRPGTRSRAASRSCLAAVMLVGTYAALTVSPTSSGDDFIVAHS